jgi:hypothetical protein
MAWRATTGLTSLAAAQQAQSTAVPLIAKSQVPATEGGYVKQMPA